MKKIIATALISTLVVGSAFAQATNTPKSATDAVTPPAATSSTGSVDTTLAPISSLSADQMVSSKIVGKSVYNTNNEKIGAVNDLILDNTGKVVGVVIGVGGFLGMGERNVALNFQSVKFTKDSKGYEKITVAATKEQLKSMTPYDTSKSNG